MNKTNKIAVDAKDIKVESKVTQPEVKKAPIRRSEMETRGRLYVDEQYKEAGYHYRIVNDNPGRVKLLQRLGYEIVTDDTKIGSDTVRDTNKLGSAVALDVGVNRSQPAVLMRIPEDEFKARKAEEAKENTAMFEQTVRDNQYKGQNTDV